MSKRVIFHLKNSNFLENRPCLREESLNTYSVLGKVDLAKVDPHLGNFSSETNPVVHHTGAIKYMEVPLPPGITGGHGVCIVL